MKNITTSPTFWYRDQADKTWNVIPSIQRNNNSEKEQVLCHSFYHGASQIMKEHIPKGSYEEWLSIMQQYGLPTRLLDWSYSPLVALFFALDREDTDASITVLVPEFLNYNQGYDAYIYPIDSSSAINLLESAFIKKIPSNKILSCYSISNDLRLYSQCAAFTIHDSTESLCEKCIEKGIYKIIIPSKRKEYFKEIIDLLGYKESFLFPDLSHVAKQSIIRHIHS